MFRSTTLPIADEVMKRAEELQHLASIAGQRFDSPVIYVFDTKSTWSVHAEAFAEATNHPKEVFLPNPYQRFAIGYCSWLLCEYAAKNFPLKAEDILEPSQPGRVRILSFFEASGQETLTAGDILVATSYLT